MADGGMRCVKYLIFIFNLLFCITGILVIIGGVLIMTLFREAVTLFGEWNSWIGATAICIGVIIFVVSFFGCCGAIRENYCMIITFATILGLILLVEIGCIAAGLVMKGRLRPFIESHLLMSDLKKYGDSDEVTIAWDQRQSVVQCCGVSNYTDWIESTHLNATFSVPGSCCIENGCNTTTLAKASEEHAVRLIYTTGCFDKMVKWTMKNIGIFLSVAFGLAFVEIMGIILSSCLACRARNKKEYV